VPLLLFDATLHLVARGASRWPARALWLATLSPFRFAEAPCRPTMRRVSAPRPRASGDRHRWRYALRPGGAPAARTAHRSRRRPRRDAATGRWSRVRHGDPTRRSCCRRGASSCGRRRRARLILVPHEPTPAHLERPERAAARRAGGAAVLGSGDSWCGAGRGRIRGWASGGRSGRHPGRAVRRRRPGYVGGVLPTWRSHLLEPAILGLPPCSVRGTTTPPRRALFLDAGAGTVVRSAADLGQALADWAGDPER
jgi:hypothetical protein